MGTGTGTVNDNVDAGVAPKTSSEILADTNTKLKPNGSEPPSRIQSIQDTKSSSQSTDPGFNGKSVIGKKLVTEKNDSLRPGPGLGVPVLVPVPVPVQVPVPVTVLAQTMGLLVEGVSRLNT
jgi:hypothetical protein